MLELQKLSDVEIRELGYEKLYAKNRLSKTNIECFVTGFQTAVDLTKINTAEDFLTRVYADIEILINDIKDTAGYSGRYLTDNECQEIKLLEILKKSVTELQK